MGIKYLSMILSVCILLSALPVQALASDIDTEEMESSVLEDQALSEEEMTKEALSELESDATKDQSIEQAFGAEREFTTCPEAETGVVEEETEPITEEDNTRETPIQYVIPEIPTDESVTEPEPFELEKELPAKSGLPQGEELSEEPEEVVVEETVSEEAMMASLTSLPSKVDLYVIEDTYADSLTLPNGYLSSYQCHVASAEYDMLDGDSVEVSSNGTIAPAYDVMYWSGGFGHSWPTGEEGEVMTREYRFGSSTIRVTSGSQSRIITVQVHNYAQEYACQVMDTYYAQHIRNDMTSLEKLNEIAAFPTQYDYSVNSCDYVGLIVKGGGDCWSSAYAIQYLCQKAGLQSHIRYGANDGGAGSGHRNVAVQIGNQVYIAEAGYVEKAPRTYNVYPENTGFLYTLEDGGAKILQYDGFQSHIVVPERIDGYPVTAIGELAFHIGETYSGVPVHSIALPSSLERLENQSLESLENLTEITIPANVSYIGRLSFADCPKLIAINVESGNRFFQSRDGVLFDNNMETLIAYPSNGKSIYSVPEGVKTISEYAFTYSYSHGVSTLFLPSTLETIGEGAFGDTPMNRIYFTGNRPEIGDAALYDLSVTVNYPSGDASWEGIEDLGSDAYYASHVVWAEWNVGSSVPTQTQKLSGARSYSKTYGDPSFRMDISGMENPKIHYRTENEDIVSVTDDGIVTIHGAGDVEIIATADPTDQYLPASVKISVSIQPKDIGKCRLVFNRMGDIPYDTDDFEPYLTLIDGDTVLGDEDYWNCGTRRGGDGVHLDYLYYSVVGEGNYTGTHEFYLAPISKTPVLKNAVVSGSKVKLTWQKEPGAMGCLIYRKIGSESYTLVKTISGVNATTWTDTLLSGCDNSVSYQIKLYTMKGTKQVVSAASATKTIYSLETPKLEKVENIHGGIKLTWGNVSNAAKYRVFYKTGNGGWTKIGDTAATTYTWKSAKSGTKYAFTVCCVSSDGKTYTSDYNTTGKSITYIAAPTISKGENVSGGMKLTWGNVAGAAKYRIFYKIGKGKWTKLADTTSTTFTWKKAKNGTTYSFTVCCISKDGKAYTSGYNTAGKSLTYVASPTLSSVKNSKAKTITANWKKLSGVTGFQIQYSTNKNFKSGSKTVNVKKASAVSQTINKLTKGKTYYVRIRSYKTVSGNNVFSAWSTVKSVKITK